MSRTFDRLLSFWEAASFDPITATLTAVSLAATAASTAVGVAGEMSAGQNAAAMGQYQAKEYAIQGQTAEATGQRAMLEERRKEGLVLSSLQARAAADGGSATDPSVLNLGRQIAGRGEYNALMDLSQGKNQEAGLMNMGASAAYGGKIAQEGDLYSAVGTAASGIGSMASTLRFGMTPPYGGSSPGYSPASMYGGNYGYAAPGGQINY